MLNENLSESIKVFIFRSSGTYSLERAQYCTVCPAGKYCPSTKNSTEILCSPGTFSFGGAAVCLACPSGWKCPNADGSGNARCLPVSDAYRITLGPYNITVLNAS